MLTTVFDFELILPGTLNILVASNACLSAPNSYEDETNPEFASKRGYHIRTPEKEKP